MYHITQICFRTEITGPQNNHATVLFFSTESTRILDVYLFLFSDFLLITKTKRNKKVTMGRNSHTYCMCFLHPGKFLCKYFGRIIFKRKTQVK